jgi:hypothetical protein
MTPTAQSWPEAGSAAIKEARRSAEEDARNAFRMTGSHFSSRTRERAPPVERLPPDYDELNLRINPD